MNELKNSIDGIKNSMDEIKRVAEGVCNFIDNPVACTGLWLKGVFISFSTVSTVALLAIGMSSLLFSILGWEKGRKIGAACPVIAILIQIIAKGI